jgi:acyl-coenzyme A thioesterase PaaI-like protein
MVDLPIGAAFPSSDVQLKIQSQYHPRCVVCSPTNPRGLRLNLDLNKDGRLTGRFQLDGSAEGYPGISHGGVIAAVLDGAMGNWLFAHDIVAVTIELNVKYRHPLHLEQEARVEARLKENMDPVYVLQASIRQGERVVARGIGRFVDRPDIGKSQAGCP